MFSRLHKRSSLSVRIPAAYPCESLEPRRLLSSVEGVLYRDDNGNDARDAAEATLAGRTVYVDEDRDYHFDAGEPTTASDAAGRYRFDGLTRSDPFLNQVVPDGWKASKNTYWPDLIDGGPPNVVNLGSVPSPSTVSLDPRFGANGRVDISFVTTARGNLVYPVALAAQPDGKLVVALGNSNTDDVVVQRYNVDGSLDVPFSANALAVSGREGFGTTPGALKVLANGKILLAGAFEGWFDLYRFNANGTLDTAFGTPGNDGHAVIWPRGSSPRVNDILVQSAGRIILVGDVRNEIVIAAFDSSGRIDYPFGGTTGTRHHEMPPESFYYEIGARGALGPGESIVVGGTVRYEYNAVARFTPNGMPDSTFTQMQLTLPPIDYLGDVGVQPDGRVVVVGAASERTGEQHYTVGRYLPNGMPDTSFGAEGATRTAFPGPGAWAQADHVEVLPDGRILTAGHGAVATSVDDTVFARYLPDGTPDPTFSGGTRTATLSGHRDVLQDLVRLPDGSIVTLSVADNFGRGVLMKMVDVVAPAASIDPAGTLVVFGTAGNDTALINRVGDSVTVELNGETQSFDAAAVARVRAHMLDGSDVLAVGHLQVPVVADGGGGTDSVRLFGTNNGDTLALTANTVTRGGVATEVSAAETLYVAAGNGQDTVSYAADPAAGVPNLTILELFGNDDIVTVTRGDPARLVEIRGGTGNDAVTVTAYADPAQRASVNFQGEFGADTFTARGTPGVDTISVSPGGFGGLGTGTAVGVESIVVEAVGGDDVVYLTRTSAGVAITIDAGIGNDVINLGDPLRGLFSFIGDATLRGGSGTDRVYADNRADDRFQWYTLDPDSLSLTDRATIAYAAVEDFTLDGGTGDDIITVVPSASTTYTVNAGAPAAPVAPPLFGDAILLGYGGATGMARSENGAGAGRYTFTNRRPVIFTGVERFDDVTPAVTSAVYRASNGPIFTFTFNKPVYHSIDARDLVITNADTGEVWTELADVQHDFDDGTTTFQFFTDPGPGRFIARLVAAGVVDDAGNPLTADYLLPFGAPAQVRQRMPFYNGSRFDGDNVAINTLDDAAIATDKVVLFRGQTGSFANYITHPSGITGLMIDIAGLSVGAVGPPRANDFTFEVAASPDAPWVAAPAPSAVQVRPGVGRGGSDRLTITWPGGSIRNTWLRVTMKATALTNLASPDVFYLASLPGESGDAANSQSGARVTALDIAAVKRSLNTDATVTTRHDFNRDGRVNALDLAAVKANLNRALDALVTPLATAGATAALTFSPGLLDESNDKPML